MNWLDLTIICILGLSILISFFRGFIRELVSLTSWVLAVILGIRYGNDLGSTLFSTVIRSTSLQHILGFVIVLILVLVVGIIINIALRNLLSRNGFSFTDAILGILFGMTRGLIVVTVLVMLLKTTQVENSNVYKTSQLVPLVQLIIDRVQEKGGQPLNQVTNWISTGDKKPQSE